MPPIKAERGSTKKQLDLNFKLGAVQHFVIHWVLADVDGMQMCWQTEDLNVQSKGEKLIKILKFCQKEKKWRQLLGAVGHMKWVFMPRTKESGYKVEFFFTKQSKSGTGPSWHNSRHGGILTSRSWVQYHPGSCIWYFFHDNCYSNFRA